jgi:hypothetical protein
MAEQVWPGRLDRREWRMWLAAVIDSEGSVLVDRRVWPGTGTVYYTLSVQVKNTHMGFLERVREVAGVGSVRQSGLVPGRKQVFTWAVRGQPAAVVLRAVHRHLIVKAEQARLGIALQETKRPRGGGRRFWGHEALQEQVWSEVSRLNRRGRTPEDPASNGQKSPAAM